jgi:hypothetical protein
VEASTQPAHGFIPTTVCYVSGAICQGMCPDITNPRRDGTFANRLEIDTRWVRATEPHPMLYAVYLGFVIFGLHQGKQALLARRKYCP